MYMIGVTGGIGSGKSTVSGILASWGLPLIDADQLSHEVTSPGGLAMPELEALFGPEILNEEGGLNRPYMANLAFRNRRALDQLSFIVHEKILQKSDQLLSLWEKKGEKACVLDYPLPVKEGFLDRCHLIITVEAPENLRLQRLASRGMEEAEARRRMAVQMKPEAYRKLAHHSLQNKGSLEELEAQLRKLVLPELEKRGIPFRAVSEENKEAPSR